MLLLLAAAACAAVGAPAEQPAKDSALDGGSVKEESNSSFVEEGGTEPSGRSVSGYDTSARLDNRIHAVD